MSAEAVLILDIVHMSVAFKEKIFKTKEIWKFFHTSKNTDIGLIFNR